MEQERKTEHLHITLTPTEKKRLSEHAKMMNLSISEYFTFVLNKKRIVICEDSRELVNQIMRIGNNINQIAAVANKNRYISNRISRKMILLKMQLFLKKLPQAFVFSLTELAIWMTGWRK